MDVSTTTLTDDEIRSDQYRSEVADEGEAEPDSDDSDTTDADSDDTDADTDGTDAS